MCLIFYIVYKIKRNNKDIYICTYIYRLSCCLTIVSVFISNLWAWRERDCPFVGGGQIFLGRLVVERLIGLFVAWKPVIAYNPRKKCHCSLFLWPIISYLLSFNDQLKLTILIYLFLYSHPVPIIGGAWRCIDARSVSLCLRTGDVSSNLSEADKMCSSFVLPFSIQRLIFTNIGSKTLPSPPMQTTCVPRRSTSAQNEPLGTITLRLWGQR